eukprot:4505033-Amphidinium_carterae.2
MAGQASESSRAEQVRLLKAALKAIPSELCSGSLRKATELAAGCLVDGSKGAPRENVLQIQKMAAAAFRKEARQVRESIAKWAAEDLRQGLGRVHRRTVGARKPQLEREVVGGHLLQGDRALGDAKAAVWGDLWRPAPPSEQQLQQLRELRHDAIKQQSATCIQGSMISATLRKMKSRAGLGLDR